MAKGAYWTWNAVLRRYYLTSEGAKALGGRAGQFVGASKMRDIRDGIVTKSQQRMESIVASYIDGRMNIADMVLAMRKEAKQTAIQQWLLSSGGRNTFTHSEAGKLGAYMRTEYAKIQVLGTQIKNGEITQAQAKLYARYQASYSTSIFERAQALSRGAGDLPVYPADGTQNCRANCRCSWRWIEDQDRWLVVWELSSGAKHCSSCIDNSNRWSLKSPFVIMKPLLERTIR